MDRGHTLLKRLFFALLKPAGDELPPDLACGLSAGQSSRI